MAWSVHTARQTKPGKKNSQSDGSSRLLRFSYVQVESISDSAEYIGKEYPTQPDRQNQRERITRGMDLHGYYALVDVHVDSISDSAEYEGAIGQPR